MCAAAAPMQPQVADVYYEGGVDADITAFQQHQKTAPRPEAAQEARTWAALARCVCVCVCVLENDYVYQACVCVLLVHMCVLKTFCVCSYECVCVGAQAHMQLMRTARAHALTGMPRWPRCQ